MVPNSTPPRVVNSQLVSLPPVGIVNKFLFHLYLVFVHVHGPTSFKYKPRIKAGFH